MAVRVYKYGCRPPTAGADLLRDQLSAAVDYYNGLFDAELARRQAIEQARCEYSATYRRRSERLTLLEEIIEQCYADVRASRAGGGAGPDEQLLSTIEKHKSERSALWKDQAAERKGIDASEALTAAKKAAQQQCRAAGKVAYQASGLFWGTRWLVDMDFARAAKKARPRRRFRRREGRVGIQVQQRAGEFQRAEDVMSSRYDHVQIEADGKYGHVRLRVGSDGSRRPLWLTLPIKMHRPLPPGAIVRAASVRVFRRGLRTRYELDLTVESETFDASLEPCETTEEACGIDVGWRQMPDGGLRVATLLGTDGALEQLVLPPALIDRIAYAEALQSATDRLFDAERAVFERTSPWWTDEQRKLWAHRGQWRTWKRLARASSDLERDHATYDAAQLWSQWKAWRHAVPKLDLFCSLEEMLPWAAQQGMSDEQAVLWHLNLWRRKTHHLVHMAGVARTRALGRRRDLYRVFARKVASRYGRIAVESMKMEGLVRVSDRQPVQNRTSRSNRVLAAPADLLLNLEHALGKKRVSQVPAAYTTITCTECGHVGEPTQDLIWQCDACGHALDQDAAAALNLLRGAGVAATGLASGAVASTYAPPLAAALPAGKKPPISMSSRRSRRRARQSTAAE